MRHSSRRAACCLTSEPEEGYRPCVGILLLDAANRVFVGQRHDTGREAWQMPQGGIDPGETVLAAGLREMAEEIGTDRASLLAESSWWRSYDLPPDLARRMWGGRYRGQTQKWLAFRFEGTDEDICIDVPHPEFKEWRWASPQQLPSLIVPFKRDVYLSVVDEFRHLWA
ncbi:RNA pyrophosphohydrolase [Geminicoccaceae bacterium 1502E]|uniref:RNA pyrophosphohydrolase n=1 Tax=Marinimicrococcus flavescens TaxID=3031815 RepID=A0AAP3UYI9_9PROT|nr:RNA pyrophosphohydrolase [Marinimicrococcus flavescens]MDX6750604.1 RNA pyrophosphohydrolase [Geminicoccaceae bacterium 1502E]